MDGLEPTLRVMALHALEYCERLFYLEEVEEIRIADEAVFAGRREHLELDEPGDIVDLTLESASLGIRGRVDALRRRDGGWIPIEHKRGRPLRRSDGSAEAWPSDRLQASAYALLVEEHTGSRVAEARVRYHRDNVTVRVPLTEDARAAVRSAIERARQLRRTVDRPPVTADERRCVRCSLAPVCLPEEARWADAPERTPVRLYPPDLERRSLHVVTSGSRVGRSGESLEVVPRDGDKTRIGAREVSDVVIHGHAQITTQALRLCADEEIPVHFVTGSGGYLGVFHGPSGGVQRRLRQYRAASDDQFALPIARRLVMAKVEMQLRWLLRATRGDPPLRASASESIATMRLTLGRAAHAADREVLMGHEGAAARAYFAALALLVTPEAGLSMVPAGRSRRPPADRFNALLSFGYALLLRDVTSSILRVGLEPSFGILHRPRSAAFPLVLDLMELFRVPLVDMMVLAAVNRRTFDPERDFVVAPKQVWLSETGRRSLLEAYERRKHEEYRHDALGFSLSYARMIELEVRLLEKEWSGEPGSFARFRIR